MDIRKRLVLGAIILTVLASTGCNRLERVIKSRDPDRMWKAAERYYKKEDYYRAGYVYEEMMPLIVGKPLAEEVEFQHAFTYYEREQYDLAAYYFKNFYDAYRYSEHAEEALYRHAYSLFMATPDFNLDQSGTNTAIQALQDFINLYPGSPKAEGAAGCITLLRQKLEKKAYALAKQYQRLKDYKAAVIAYDNFQKDFPDSDFQQEVAFRKIESQYKLADLSIFGLKKERYEECFEQYRYFLERYPEGEYLEEADKIYGKAQNDYRNHLDERKKLEELRKRQLEELKDQKKGQPKPNSGTKG